MPNKTKKKQAVASKKNNTASNTIKQLTQQVSQLKASKKATPFADTGSIVGRAAGSLFGRGDIGSSIGKWLGSGIGSIFGSGDYAMVGSPPSYNVLTNSKQIPQFSSTAQTNIVCHREYLGDIVGTAGFSNIAYPLNPGLSQTFPWLATVAQNYQEYKFHGIVFEFRPLITDFVTSGAPGVVVMATNYNADAPVYANKQQMENSEFAVSVKPTVGLMHGVECAIAQTTFTQRYIRTGAVPSNQDLRLYDYGNFQFATQSNPVQNLGELWVSYCVEFFKPVIPATIGGTVASQHVYRTNVTSAKPLGDTSSISTGNINLTFSSTVLSFPTSPSTKYLITLGWQGANNLVTAPSVVLSGTLSALSILNNDAASTQTAPTGGASTSFIAISTLTIMSSNITGTGTITFSGASFVGAWSLDVIITEIDSTITS